MPKPRTLSRIASWFEQPLHQDIVQFPEGKSLAHVHHAKYPFYLDQSKLKGYI